MEIEIYISPLVEIIEVEVEMGFVVSQQEGSEWNDM